MDELGLYKAELIHRRGPWRSCEAVEFATLGVSDGDVLAASIAVVHEPASLHGPPIMESLFQSVQDEAGMRRPAHPPADDPAGIGVDDKGDIDEAGPGRDVGEVGDP